MLSFAAGSLGKERVRLAISAGGVAFAVMLIVLLRGLHVAYETKVSDVWERVPVDLWVAQSGTADFFHLYSLVADSARTEIAAVPGVEAVHPYLARQVGFSLRDEQTLLYVVGFDPADPVNGPAELVSGTERVASDEIVIDEIFADNHDVRLGDTLTLNGFDLDVTGISGGGDLVMYQYAYVPTSTARRVLSMPEEDNALLVQLAPGADPAIVADQITTASPRLMVRDTDAMVAVNQRVIDDPPLILADEPTANLDSGSGYEVLHLLGDITTDHKTLVMVTHDHRITTVADRLLWLSDGRLRDRAADFATAADPVCGMEIVTERAAAHRRVGATTLYFCSMVCADRFDAAPDRFIKQLEGNQP